MAVVNELIRAEADGSISFGNYELETKTKVSGFEHEGNLYKVKTFKEITKLECNDMFVYESVPGTVVTNFITTEEDVSFTVEGVANAQVIVGLDSDTDYAIRMNGELVDCQKTNLGGKLSMSMNFVDEKGVRVSIRKK